MVYEACCFQYLGLADQASARILSRPAVFNEFQRSFGTYWRIRGFADILYYTVFYPKIEDFNTAKMLASGLNMRVLNPQD